MESPDKSGALGYKGWREERGVQDTLTNHCQHRHSRVTAGLGGLEGTVALHRAQLNPRAGWGHIVRRTHSDPLARGGLVLSPAGKKVPLQGNVARISAESFAVQRVEQDPAEKSVQALQRRNAKIGGRAPEMEDVENTAPPHTFFLFFFSFSSGGISVQSVSPPGLSGTACACGQ